MRRRIKPVFGASAAAVAIALLVSAGTGVADPPETLVDPPKHRHFIVVPHDDGTNELVAVGPQICKNPNLRQAFNEFHYNVHHSEVPGIGDVPTNGPQDGAPGVSDEEGPRVTGVRGCP